MNFKQLKETPILKEMVELRQEGKYLKEIADIIEKKYNYKFTLPMIDYYIKLSTNKSKDKIDNNPQSILYENRYKIIQMRKDFVQIKDIAREFNVTEDDVNNFLSKRTKLSSEEYREILYKHSQGYSNEDIAEDYNINIKSVEKILSKKNILQTQSKAIATNQDLVISQEEFIDVIRKFLNLIDKVRIMYTNKRNLLKQQDNDRNDIYHKIEIQDMSEKEKLQIIEHIKQLSIERRKNKDFIDISEKLVEYLDNNTAEINDLMEALNNILEEYKKQQNRVYFVKNTQGE